MSWFSKIRVRWRLARARRVGEDFLIASKREGALFGVAAYFIMGTAFVLSSLGEGKARVALCALGGFLLVFGVFRLIDWHTCQWRGRRWRRRVGQGKRVFFRRPDRAGLFLWGLGESRGTSRVLAGLEGNFDAYSSWRDTPTGSVLDADIANELGRGGEFFAKNLELWREGDRRGRDMVRWRDGNVIQYRNALDLLDMLCGMEISDTAGLCRFVSREGWHGRMHAIEALQSAGVRLGRDPGLWQVLSDLLAELEREELDKAGCVEEALGIMSQLGLLVLDQIPAGDSDDKTVKNDRDPVTLSGWGRCRG